MLYPLYIQAILSESKLLPETNTTKDKTDAELNEKIKLVCRNIKWGEKDYIYHKNFKEKFDFDFEEFNSFVVNNKFEFDYLKTILPENCFNQDNTLNKDEIISLIKDENQNRKYRQYIFGFRDDVEKYSKFKLFYEIYNIDSGRIPKCNNLVNWSIILNMLYNRCSISNDDIIFSARFILPNQKNINTTINTKYNSKSLDNLKAP